MGGAAAQIAHVVQAIEEGDQIKSVLLDLLGLCTFKANLAPMNALRLICCG